jgi:hypothetical protein
MQYGLRPCFRKRPVKEDAVTFLHRQLKARPGELTLLAIGPLTNVAELLRRHPECKPWIRRLVVMGGAVNVDYEGKSPACPEWNVKEDVKAAQAVLSSGLPIVLVPLDVTWDLKLTSKKTREVLDHGSALTDQLAALFSLGDGEPPILFDPLAALWCLDESLCELTPMRLTVDERGITRVAKGEPNVRVAMKARRAAAVDRFATTLTTMPGAKPARLKATNPARPVERGGLPARVHVFEDYETDIERRWWLAGALRSEKGNRYSRGVLCDDFDDRMGNPRGLHTAVIFNPVPGPPMGKSPRLSFRCRLDGADLLRVQIYSLSRGYHRHLTLTGLPQRRWLDLAVDMTQARRPDGSGGPLAEDERIDDIQFYTQRGAELAIDDITLYEPAPPGEKRPFPKRFLFTGWFDTGRQGAEWPGAFDIVAHQPPLKWKVAQGVADAATRTTWVRLDLRGPRPVRGPTEVRFRYRTDADALTVEAADGKRVAKASKSDVVKGKWADATIALPLKGFESLRELRFRVPEKASLLVDDVLIYQP